MIRFDHGEPKSIWYSQHAYGEAFTYEAVEKSEKRPIAYSAKGSHANYAVAGKHDLHATSIGSRPSHLCSFLIDLQVTIFQQMWCLIPHHKAHFGILPSRHIITPTPWRPRSSRG
jgi:hypothetical protein